MALTDLNLVCQLQPNNSEAQNIVNELVQLGLKKHIEAAEKTGATTMDRPWETVSREVLEGEDEEQLQTGIGVNTMHSHGDKKKLSSKKCY